MILTVTLNPSLDEWAWLPRLRVGALNRAAKAARYPGGKGINVSRVAHELGHPTLALALAGGDDGEILSRLLSQQRIAHQFVTVPGSTRNNYQLQTQTRPTEPAPSSLARKCRAPRGARLTLTQVNTPGPRASAAVLARLSRRMVALAASAQAVVCSGSLPPGAPPSTYRRLIARLTRRVLTVLDAEGPALREGLRARPWLIKPNRQEAEELLGYRLRRERDVLRGAQALCERGAQHAIISLGAAGAVLACTTAWQVWRARAPEVRVQSAVGAGDALVAGFVVGWLRTRSLEEAFRLGMACGSATALTPGTELCHRADVERLRSRVTLRMLDVAGTGAL